MDLIVRPRADRDIDEIADYLVEEAGIDMGLQFLSDLYKTFLLASQREMGWRCQIRHSRLLQARTFRVSDQFEKYLIFYQPYNEHIEVLRVLHGAQDLPALFSNHGFE